MAAQMCAISSGRNGCRAAAPSPGSTVSRRRSTRAVRTSAHEHSVDHHITGRTKRFPGNSQLASTGCQAQGRLTAVEQQSRTVHVLHKFMLALDMSALQQVRRRGRPVSG